MPVNYPGNPVAGTESPYFAKDFFVYEADILNIGPGQTQTTYFTIQADSDFLWTKAAYFADTGAGGITSSNRVIPLATVLVQDTGSGRILMANAVPIVSMFGTGELPFILPRQRIFVARSQVQVNVTNFSTADTYNIRLSFIGEKAFRK